MNQQPQSNGSAGQQQGLKPFVRIVEQPAKCAIRFRYECEGRSAGSIPGVHSTAENKSFPTIQVCNYRGKAVVVVSCVTKDPPYRPHPHNLVGKEGCKKGVCTLVIDNNPDMTCTFTSLGIQCVKRKDIEESLKLRELIKVDPFRTGFNHRSQASSIDLNVVRLCFQVFIEGPDKGKFTVQLPPIVSEAIYDKKAMAELIITKLSHYSAPCTGGKEIILLCDRVAKDDVQVRFYQESVEGLHWEAYGEFLPNDVHKQVAISLRTPKYYDESIQQPVTVQIQLRRPSDGCTSLSRSFQLTPRELDPDGLVRKRHKRLKEENYDLLQEYIQLATSSGAVGNPGGAQQPGKRSASVSFGAKPVAAQMSPKKENQLPSMMASTPGPSGSRSPFVQFQGAAQAQPQSIQAAQSNESSNSPKSQSSPTSQFLLASSPHHAQHQQQFIYTELGPDQAIAINFAGPVTPGQPRPLSQGGSSSPSHGYPAPQKASRTPSHQTSSSYTTPPILQEQGTNLVYQITTNQPESSPNPYALYQQQAASPNPSLAGSYTSEVPSPGQQLQTGYQMNQPIEPNNNPEPLPNEMMERFDSLEIDSSELIPNLFNSNTILDIMMDTSSGLSLNDSFSDITNGNVSADSKLTKSYNNGDEVYNTNLRNSQRSRLKLQLGGSNPALPTSTSIGGSTTNTMLDTPTIEMIGSGTYVAAAAGGFDATGAQQIVDPNLLSVLDVDNNNI